MVIKAWIKTCFSSLLLSLASPNYGVIPDIKYNTISTDEIADVENMGANGSFAFLLEKDVEWKNATTPLMPVTHQKDWYFTSADDKNKKGVSLLQSGKALFSVRTNRELIFDHLSHLRIQNSICTDDSFIILHGADLSISNTAEVSLKNNQTNSTFSPLRAGVILANTGAHVRMFNNTRVDIEGNSISSADVVQGGAIVGGYSGYISLHHNTALNITNNSANGNAEAYGGAFFVRDNSDAQWVMNDTVQVSGNHVTGESAACGGAIYSEGNILIAGNKSVTFENNYENTDGNITLRSISVSSYYTDKKLELSAPENGHITFYDSIRVDGNTSVQLNASGTDLLGNSYTGGGDIVFSGATTRQHLEAILKRAATDEEVTASRTSVIQGLTQLHAGSLIVEDDAILCGFGLTALAGNNANIVLKSGHLHHAGYTIELRSGTTLTSTGQSSIQARDITFKSGATLAFHLDAAMNQQHSLTLSGNVVWEDGAILSLRSNGALRDGAVYSLLTHQGISGTPGYWTESAIRIDAETARFDDFYWQNGTLFYKVKLPTLTAATWCGDESRRWDKSGFNWKQSSFSYAYTDDLPVIFGDTGCGELELIGDLSPQSVTVNNSDGKDYTWKAATGGGQLTGGMKLVKHGAGALNIALSNSYTGGTEISGGTLVTQHSRALGNGDILLLGGRLTAESTLNLGEGQRLIFQGGLACGEISTAANSRVVLNQDAEYTSGTFTLGGGTIDFQQHHLDISGTLSIARETLLNVQDYTAPGAYKLISWQTLVGNTNLLTLQTSDTDFHYMLHVQDNCLTLHITGDTLKWTQLSGTWSTGSTGGWESGVFTDGAHISFAQGGSCDIVGKVCPASIRVSGAETTHFTGAGSISGQTILTKEGSGTLKMGTANDFTGNVILNGGTLEMLHPDALGKAEVEVNTATLKLSAQQEIKQSIRLADGMLDGAATLADAGQIHVQNRGTMRGHLHLNGGSLSLQENANFLAAGGMSQQRGSVRMQRFSRLQIDGHLTLSGGNIYLAHGATIEVKGSLTLNGSTHLELESGAFADGTILISTQGDFIGSLDSLDLHYNGNLTRRSAGEYELKFVDNNVVLHHIPEEPILPPAPQQEPKPKKTKHLELSLANWGIALASNTFVDALHGAQLYSGAVGESRNRIWVSGLGGYLSLNDVTTPEIFVCGAALGVEFGDSSDSKTGAAFGYTYGMGGNDDWDNVQQHSVFVALYGSNTLHRSDSASDIVTLHWSLACGHTDSEMEDGSAAVSPLSLQADTRVSWSHSLSESFSTHLFGGAQYLAVRGDETATIETNALRYLRAESGVGCCWGITDDILVYAESSLSQDLIRQNPCPGRNPGRTGFRASIGLQETLKESWMLHAHYSFERRSHTRQHSCHISLGRSF